MRLRADMTTSGDQERDIRCPSVQAVFTSFRKSEFEILNRGIHVYGAWTLGQITGGTVFTGRSGAKWPAKFCGKEDAL